MRAKIAEKLSRSALLPRLDDGFIARGMLVYHRDTEWLLRGYCYENTGHPGADGFYFWLFVQPLYSPAQHLVLDTGERLGLWRLQDNTLPPDLVEVAQTAGRNFLSRLERPVDLASLLEQRLQEAPGNTRLLEDAAYSQILAGDDQGALSNLGKIEAAYQGRIRADWERALVERAQRMSRAIQEAGDAPVRLLRAYRDSTVAALGIQRQS